MFANLLLRKLLLFVLSFYLVSAHSFNFSSQTWELTQEFKKSFVVISDPQIDPDTKSLAVDQLFLKTKHLCEIECEALIDTIKMLNTKLNAEKIEQLIAKIPLDEEQKKLIDSKTIQESKENIDRFINKVDRTKIKHQMIMSMELIRFLISIEEKQIFALQSSNTQTKEKAIARIKDDSTHLYKQGRALYDLFQAFQEHDKSPNRTQMDPRLVQRILKDLDDLGIFYFKLAQSLSNLSVLPSQLNQELKKFQDEVRLMDPQDVLRIIREDFGKDASEVFVDFDASKPLKSGTVAQTYKAKIKTLWGLKEVIIKVQRPGLGQELDWNSKINKTAIKVGQIFTPESYAWALDLLSGAVMGLETAFQSELDFNIERRNLERFRRFFLTQPRIHVPKVFSEFSSSRVLTMEKVEGENIERLLEKYGQKGDNTLGLKQKKKIFSQLLNATIYQVFVLKDAHADLHPGNILATVDGRLNLIDWGQTFSTKGSLIEPAALFYNLLMGDAEGVAKHFLKMGKSKNSEEFRNFVHQLFLEKKIQKTTLFEVMKKRSKDTFESFDKIMELLSNIAKEAVTKYEFRATEQYLQFFRSIAPVSSTLIILSKEIPREHLNNILFWKTIQFAPRFAFEWSASKILKLYQSTYQMTESTLVQIWNSLSSPTEKCSLHYGNMNFQY